MNRLFVFLFLFYVNNSLAQELITDCKVSNTIETVKQQSGVFIPQNVDRKSDSKGLNILVLEGKFSPDRPAVKFPRQQSMEFKEGVSAYLSNTVSNLSTDYLDLQMPYLRELYFLEITSLIDSVNTGMSDRELTRLYNVNSNESNVFLRFLREHISQLSQQEVNIDIILIYAPYLPEEFGSSIGNAISNCTNLSHVPTIRVNTREFIVDSLLRENLAEIILFTSHEFGHTMLLNHELDNQGGIVNQSSPCSLDNWALSLDNDDLKSVMVASNNVTKVGNYFDSFKTLWSPSNANRLLLSFENRKWLNICEMDTLYIDFDNDGFPDISSAIDTCIGSQGFVSKRNDGLFDCNDLDPAINPAQQEIVNNDIDDNCDGINEISTSIKENNDKLKVEVYPNPSGNVFNIDYDFRDTFRIRIYNIHGQLIGSFVDTKRIDMSQYKSGLYLLEILDENNYRLHTSRVFLN